MEKNWKINENRFNTKLTYGDDDKYIKTKIQTWRQYNYKFLW